ncbi:MULTISPECIES: PPC domain-containing DNA-binding protein [Rhizobium]|uniref:PPC domain-containing DNA-binding protein n=1 Tax=Rhizobium TaxID=379 RepID=UPI001FEF78CB|nr:MULTISPECIES: PPC domain-containing DNA-binding protein [Rhizobium]WSH30842.1 PPC domain-containing DNA-binding protein [Rhizobium beringeri]WSH83291.1 PPC domain-containing DNA-binding protein [Rhizobium beringeri]
MAEQKRYISIPDGFLMVLRQGDDVLACLGALMVDEDIPSAMLSGFGFAAQITFGFFDFEAREYKPKSYENVEVTNLTGSLAWKDGKPLPHLHATAGNASFEAVGGHLLALEVGRGSMELYVTILPNRLERATDASIGANVLQLSPAV